MKLLQRLRHLFEVEMAGNAFLRWERLRQEWRMARPGFWRHPHLAPPLPTSPWLKELISRHYLRGRHADRETKVAWVTSGAPHEFLLALGYFVHYPENHGAVCGIRRVAEDLCGEAESAGWSRDICSYARTDFGMVLSGRTPVGRVAPPDLLLACTNICQTVLYWYRVLAHRFRVPLILIDTPFLYREAADRDLRYVERQLEEGVEVAERVMGRQLSDTRLREVTEHSREAVELWKRVIERAREKPSPISAFDEFIHMAPIVEMRGERTTVDYYRALLRSLDERVAKGVGALRHERVRLLWDNLPIWHRMRWFSDLLAERGAALVASTYTNAWGELAPLIDPAQPIESAARVYLHPILNRGTGHKLETIRRMAEEYSVDGVILHSDRSCKPYSIGQLDQSQKLSRESGVPSLVLEADHNDPRAFGEEQASNRLAAFLELLEA